MNKLLATSAAALIFVVPAARAQDAATQSPLQSAIESPADKPITIAGPIKHADPEFERLLELLAGSFRALPAAADQPALRLNSARITVDGLDNAVYFEIAREDSPANPFRQGVFHLYRRGKEIRLRVLDFRVQAGFGEMLAGLWAAPDTIPALSVAQLAVNLDIVLKSTAKGATGRTPHPFPTMTGGAVEMTSAIELNADLFSLHDVGYDASGSEVWGNDSRGATKFARQPAPWFSVKRLDGGLVVITTVAPAADAPTLVEGGETALHFSSWLTDGTRFNTSRAPGRDAVRLRLPTQPKGLSDGLVGIALGERRKMIIPPALAYGEQGARNVIPPNSTLIFETECMFIDNSNPQPNPPPVLPGHGR